MSECGTAARRIPLAVAVTTGGGSSAARSAGQFRLRQCNAMQVRSPIRLRQCNAMQVRSPSRQDRDYEYIRMKWGIKIAEFLVEMELYTQKQSDGKQLFDSHWLVISQRNYIYYQGSKGLTITGFSPI